MRVGLALPQYGRFADPSMAVRVAIEAERIGFDSLWVGDRLLLAKHPRSRYPGGRVPAEHSRFLDPLTLLSAAAAVTTRVRLGTSALTALWQPPVLLARTLATLDQLSGGRLDVGIGLGWSRDEYEAVGVPFEGRGARLDETLDVLRAVWADSPVSHQGPLWTVPSSLIDVKPAGVPPVLLAAFTPAALVRVARRADGWLGVGQPLPALRATAARLTELAVSFGRTGPLRMPTRVNPVLTDSPADPSRVPSRGTVQQVAGYLAEAGTVVDEVLIDLQLTATGEQHLVDLAGDFLARLKASGHSHPLV